MAMNKRERAEMQTLRERLALRWDTFADEDIARDVPVSSGTGGWIEGWDCNPSRVAIPAFRAWSEGNLYGEGPYPGPGYFPGGSRRSSDLFSTESRALKAARRAMAEDFAAKLAALDDKIADAISREKGEGR